MSLAAPGALRAAHYARLLYFVQTLGSLILFYCQRPGALLALLALLCADTRSTHIVLLPTTWGFTLEI